MQPALECNNIDVKFGSVHALKNVSIKFAQGEIHALLGQNGAGKSTIAKVMSGVLVPQTGTLDILSHKIELGVEGATQAAGLDIVHQRFALPPEFEIAEALEFASARKMGGAFYSKRQIEEKWQAHLADAGIHVSANSKLTSLPVETAQSIEIIRAMANDAKVLILDEPTALLSPKSIDGLFNQLRMLKEAGVTIIVILHKLKEVMAIADTVSVLRQGNLALTPTPINELDEHSIREHMIGSQAETKISDQTPSTSATKEKLVEFLSITSEDKGAEPGLKGVSFTLNKNEILGVAGVEGNGQRSLVELLTGLIKPTNGELLLHGEQITSLSVSDRRTLGIRAVPFDRMTEGASLTLPLWENIRSWMADKFQIGRWPFVNPAKMRQSSEEVLNRYGVVYDSVKQLAGNLSGGNLQRVILARELSGDISAVVAAQPTRGLDFSATNFVWQELNRVRQEGAGVLLISSDLDELFNICDRILVLQGGENAGVFEREFSIEKIGHAMVGAQ